MAPQASYTATLQTIGTDVIRSFISVVVETWLVAIYTILVIKASTILLHKDRRRNKSSFATWILVFLMYLMDVILWVVDVRNVVAELAILTDTQPDSLGERYAKSSDSIRGWSLADNIMYAFMTIMGDIIVLRRVYAFWSHERRDRLFMLVPCTTWCISLILSFLLGYCAARADATLSSGQFEHPAFCRDIQSAAYWAQFATSAVSTLMIGIKTWIHRRMVKTFLADMYHRSPVSRAMLIIVDTGVLYTLFFLAEVLLNIGVLDGAIDKIPRLDFVLEVYDFQTSTIVGLYPTVIVILIHTHCFMLDSEGNTTISSGIVFAHSQTPRFRAVTITIGDNMRSPSTDWQVTEGFENCTFGKTEAIEGGGSGRKAFDAEALSSLQTFPIITVTKSMDIQENDMSAQSYLHERARELSIAR